MKSIRALFPLGVVSLVTACGGGGGGSSTPTIPAPPAAALSASYPEGVSGSSPTALSDSTPGTVTAMLNTAPHRRISDWAGNLFAAMTAGDSHHFFRTLGAGLPLGSAWATPAKAPEGKAIAEYIAAVANGSKVPVISNVGLQSFFHSYTPASCYGPSVAYATHDDNNSAGTLPGGDTGMWLSRNGDPTTGTPCSAAQLSALIHPIKTRTNASMILTARMRALAVDAGGLPASGASTDLTSSMNTFFQTLLPPGITGSVSSAGISNASGVYTYSFVASGTADSMPKKMAIKMVHDGSSTNFTGRLTYATTESTACNQANGGAAGVTSNVGTVRYVKASSTENQVSSREATVCVAGNASNVNLDFSSYMELTSNLELNPAVTENASVKGWTQAGSGFKRFAATFDPATTAGNYKFAWQAGIGDSHSRMFAMNITRDSSTETLTGKAFFGFSGAMGDTSANAFDLKGMICNWAGPGNNHNPGNNYQYQSITLSSSASDWAISAGGASDKISYAPTNACSSSATMRFDVNADNTLGATEGNSITSHLDTLDPGTATVQETLVNRGFANPALF